MIGAIIGDIVGSRFEFEPTNDYNFPFVGAGCSITDDSVCTCAVADAIMHGKTYTNALRNWGRKYPHPQGGYGGMFCAWLHSVHPQPYNSYGNGSAMRVSPVGWLFTGDDVVAEAKKSAECTHNHAEGIKGACATADAIQMALSGKYTNNKIVDAICKKYGYTIDIDLPSIMNYHDITCQGTVPVALRCFNDADDYEDAIRRAIALGVDADTIGAIVGGIAEAYWGVPQRIVDMCAKYIPDDMKQIVREFYSRVQPIHGDKLKYTI